MSTTTTTALTIGSEYSYSTIVSHADFWFAKGSEKGHRSLGFRKGRECSPGNGNRSCTKCYDQWEDHTSTIVAIQHYMDNSVEVTLADGTTHTAVMPHGDVCF